jgi:predicted RNA-binding Zn-ribbon protein involved in translation (DUF1610 family)
MLVSCPVGCKLGQTTSDASLDISCNEAVCNSCGLIIPVSSFTKRAMEVNGDVIKEKKKAFLFDCLSCKKRVEASKKNGVVVGKNCGQGGGCMLNTTKAMISAIEAVVKEEPEE